MLGTVYGASNRVTVDGIKYVSNKTNYLNCWKNGIKSGNTGYDRTFNLMRITIAMLMSQVLTTGGCSGKKIFLCKASWNVYCGRLGYVLAPAQTNAWIISPIDPPKAVPSIWKFVKRLLISEIAQENSSRKRQWLKFLLHTKFQTQSLTS